MLPAFSFLQQANNTFSYGNVANVATLRKHPHSIFVEV